MLEDNDMIKASFAFISDLSDQFQCHMSEQDQGCDLKYMLFLVHTNISQTN